MICETERSPFEFVGSIVNRNNGASTMVLVTGATATLECVSLNKSGTDLCEARRGDLIGREGLGGRGLMLPRVVA
jgi:hypothetical protein